MRLVPLVMLLVCLTAPVGCRRDASSPPSRSPTQARTDVALQVVVAGDPELAAAIRRLRGEWSEVSQGSLEVQEIPAEQLDPPSLNRGDLVVFPSRYLGALCEQETLRPVRESVLKSESLALSNLLPQVRDQEMQYGGQVMALSLGTPVGAMLYRRDALAAAGRETPHTWRQLGESLAALRVSPPTEGEVPESTTPVSTSGMFSLAEFGAAYAFLWQSAAYAHHMNRPATLFDPQSMQPRIDAAPFVRGLAELCQSGQPAESGTEQAAGEAVFRTIRLASRPQVSVDPALAARIQVAALPGSEELYNPDAEKWETNETGVRRVTVLTGEGRLVGVTSASRKAPAAFRLAAWLTQRADSPGGAVLAPIALCRKSQARALRPFGSDPRVASLNEQCGRLAVEALSSRDWVSVPRIPGVDEYLSVLSEQVRAAIAGECTSDAALAECLSQWERITDRLGRERQAAAYRESLNLR